MMEGHVAAASHAEGHGYFWLIAHSARKVYGILLLLLFYSIFFRKWLSGVGWGGVGGIPFEIQKHCIVDVSGFCESFRSSSQYFSSCGLLWHSSSSSGLESYPIRPRASQFVTLNCACLKCTYSKWTAAALFNGYH